VSEKYSVANQVILIPLTLVFFIIIGVVVADFFNLEATARNSVILGFSFIGFIVAILEFVVVMNKAKKLNLLNTESEREKFEEKQRQMILKAFGDDLDEENEKQ
jgi:mannose/fructose/N-acetylgalactosamine-specific phosphotransferase system component IIC